MKAVLQRVSSASVMVEGEALSQIEQGYLILLGVEQGDTPDTAKALADKTAALRVFEDDGGKLNRSVQDIQGDILVVSNFTLCADCRKGNRPSFTNAAPPAEAERLYERYCALLREKGIRVETGRFSADMKVSLVNDGPVTILLENQ